MSKRLIWEKEGNRGNIQTKGQGPVLFYSNVYKMKLMMRSGPHPTGLRRSLRPGKLDEQGCKGASDLDAKIIPAHTAAKDLKSKRQLYEKVGVKKYWLVDPSNKIVRIYEIIENGQYGKPRIYTENDQVKVTILPDLIIVLSTVFNEWEVTSVKSFRKELFFHTKERVEIINITDQVAEVVAESGIKEGLCLVNAMHITASVFINDHERGLWQDYRNWLEKLAPHDPISQYLHNRTGEDNGDAHLKRQIMGREVVVAVTDGKLDFGPWEQIFYGEFDGQRQKRVLVKIIGE